MTWRTFKTTIKKYRPSSKCLSRILHICSPDIIGNINSWEGQHHLTAGYEVKSEEDNGDGLVASSGNQHQLSPGRPWYGSHKAEEKEPVQRTLGVGISRQETAMIGHILRQNETNAQDRRLWKRFVNGSRPRSVYIYKTVNIIFTLGIPINQH